MIFNRPFTPNHNVNFSVVALDGYCGGSWNVVANHDRTICRTGHLFEMVQVAALWNKSHDAVPVRFRNPCAA